MEAEPATHAADPAPSQAARPPAPADPLPSKDAAPLEASRGRALTTSAPEVAPAPQLPPKSHSTTDALANGTKRMTLWEREAFDLSEGSIEAKREAKIAALDEARAKEAAEAEARMAEFKQQEKEREAAERERIAADQVAKKKREEEAEERQRQELQASEEAMASEQEKLNNERLRQEALRKQREAPPERIETEDFAYGLADGMGAKIKKFRQRGTGGDAFLIKIEHEHNELRIEEEFHGTTLEKLGEQLDTEPRYLLYIHKVAHRDGRVQFPISFIVYLPENIPVHLKVLYTRPIVTLCDTFKVNKHFPIDDPDDLDEEWLMKHLGM
uniref:ADF-H domain-containing protein n=1 Tax=Haptolina ericina TaxID=156174 RepID=A0A7S3AKH9_9EUKA